MPLGYAGLTWSSNLGKSGIGSSGLSGSPTFGLTDIQHDPMTVGIYQPQIWGGADQLVRRNLLTYSEDFSQWSKTNCTESSGAIVEDGTASSVHRISLAGISVSSGRRYIARVRAKKGLQPRIQVALGSTQFGVDAYGYFDLNGGAISVSGASATCSISSLGGGIYECTVSAICTTGGSNSLFLNPATATNNTSYNGTLGATAITVYRAEYFSSDTRDQSYQKVTDWTTEVYAYNAQRQLPWLCRNLFNNTISCSSVFAQSDNGLFSSNAGPDPDGANIADKFYVGTGNNYWGRGNASFSTVSGYTYTFSIYVKAIELSWIAIRFYNSVSSVYAFFNVSTGQVGTVDPSITASISQENNGYYRVYVSKQATLTTTLARWSLFAASSDGASLPFVNAASGSGYLICRPAVVVADHATTYQRVATTWPAEYTALAQAAGYPITLYSDRAGTIAVDSPETVVGVELDLSKQLSFSADLVTNGQFNNGVTGWAPNGSATIANVSAELEITITGSAGGALVTLTTNVVAGKTYAMYIDIRAGTYASELTIKIPSSSTVVNVTPTSIKTNYRAVFMAAATSNTFLIARNAVATGTVYIDNVMLFEIAGNHLVAPSDAARPLLKRDGNGNFYLLRDLVDDSLNVTLPNYGSNCVHYRSTDKSVLKDSAITLNGATAFSEPSVDYGRVLLSGPSNNDAKIQKYLDSIAGRSSPAVLGPELVTNGGFDSDTGWTKEIGWTISGGTANFTPNGTARYIYPTGFTVTAGKTYQIQYTVLNYSGGSIQFAYGNTITLLPAVSGNGAYQAVVTPTGSNDIYFKAGTTFAGSIDNVSFREVIL